MPAGYTVIYKRWRSHEGTPGGGGGIPQLLTTITLVNTSGSTQTTNFVAPMFGHPFKKGDIPSSQFPKFELTDGTNIAYAYTAKATWNDGSWKHAGFILGPVPSSIAGSGTLTINIKNGGSAPANGSRALTDISAQDLKVELTSITNLSGTWTSAANTGISDNDDLKEITIGGNHRMWRVRQEFRDTTPANHGQLECYHYLQALTDTNGALYGLRWLPRIVQPWLDIDSPAKNKRGFTVAMKNGTSTSGLTQPSTGLAKAYSATSGNSSITCTAHGYDNGIALQLSTPPAGFSASTDYYTRVIDADHFQLHPTAGDSVDNFNVITPSGNGSGTATPHIEVVHFASFFGPASNRFQYVQGGGSVATEATVRIQFDKAYCRSTKLVPPYDGSITPNDITSGVQSGSIPGTYTPNGKSGLRMFFGTTGEDMTIGPQPSWVPAHFLKQNAVNEDVVRASAMAMADVPFCVKQHSTFTIPVLNASSGTPYAGMGTASSTMRWDGTASHTSGFTNPSGDLIGCIDAPESSHWPSPIYYAYLITGEPQYADLLSECANYMVITRAAGESRNPTTGGTFFGCTFQDPSQARTDAWGSREVALAAGILPAVTWENANLGTYHRDLASKNYDSIVAYNGAQSSFWTTNGIYHFRDADATGAPWQHHYLIESTSFAAAMTELSSAMTFLNHLVKFPAAVDTDIGVYHMTAYTNRMRQTDSGAGAIVSAMSQIHWSPGGNFSANETPATDTVNLTVGSSEFTLSTDDKLLWMLGAPAGLTAMTSYFARDVSDPGQSSNKTCKVALTSGGTPVDITGSSGGVLCLRMGTIPSSGKSLDYQSDSGYATIARSAYRYAEAVGATGMGSIRSKIDTIVANMGISFTDAKEAMQATF